MMKVLITGAAGFVGTNLTKALLARGESVIAVDSLSRTGSERNLEGLKREYEGLVFYRREIEDVPALIYRESPDLVFHFAAQVAVTSSLENPTRDFRINAEGSFLVAQAARVVGAPVIYTSTNKVYGNNANLLPLVERPTRWEFPPPYAERGIPETFSIDAAHHTPYGISKLVGELYVREFGGIANRCSCMYGPHQFGIVDQGWLSHLATNQVLGRPTVIYGDGKQVRDILHVRDLVDLLLRQADGLSAEPEGPLAGAAFNVGGGFTNTVSLLELCELWSIEPTFAPWRQADQRVFYCDVSKATALLGWSPTVGLEEGLADLLDWTRRSLEGTGSVS